MPAYRETADAYGVHVTVHVEHRPDTTPEELDRALTTAVAQVKARHGNGEP